MTTPEESDAYALGLADASYDWYRSHAIRSRRRHRAADIGVIVVSAAVSASVAVLPGQSWLPALLGAVVVVLTSIRSVFHWQENYLRYSAAREAVEAERRLFHVRAAPYDDEARAHALVAAVTRIEQEEMGGWLQLAAERRGP